MFNQLFILLVSAVYVISAFQKTTYTYKTVGNLSILADVYVPDKSLYNKYPVFFATHGGGFVIGDKNSGFSLQELEEIMLRGWVAVSIDYRLAPGALIDEIMEDVQDAYDWVHNELAQNLTIDLDRITVFGGSAGGGIAVLNGYKLTPRPRVVISFYPFCTNFTDPYSFNPDTPLPDSIVMEADNVRQTIAEYTVSGSPDPRMQLFSDALATQKFGWVIATENPSEPNDQLLQKLTEFSAVFNVDVNYPPTYLAHGLADALVPYNQSVQMGAVLAAKNIPYKLDLVPGANHGFDGRNVSLAFWAEHILPAFNFAAEHMLIDVDEEVMISI